MEVVRFVNGKFGVKDGKVFIDARHPLQALKPGHEHFSQVLCDSAADAEQLLKDALTLRNGECEAVGV